MLVHATGPPTLRPHVRQRRLAMAGVMASHKRQIERNERQRYELEDEYAQLAIAGERQRRGDLALQQLANQVAAFLSAEWRPPLTLASEPARIIGAGETEIRK